VVRSVDTAQLLQDAVEDGSPVCVARYRSDKEYCLRAFSMMSGTLPDPVRPSEQYGSGGAAVLTYQLMDGY